MKTIFFITAIFLTVNAIPFARIWSGKWPWERRLRLFALGFFLGIAPGIAHGQVLEGDTAQEASVLYATGVGSLQLSALYTIDPVTGAASVAWPLDSIHVYAGGLAYDSVTDTLYTIGVLDSDTGTSRLFSINRFTGEWIAFPGMSPPLNLSLGGLAINPLDGVMYATGQDGGPTTALFTVDKSTGAPTFVGRNGNTSILYDLGFRSDGTLFANGISLNDGNSHLFTVNLATGLATDIGPHGIVVGRQLGYGGLAFGSDETLYSLGSISASAGGLYSVNPATGAATIIGGTVARIGVDGGLAFAPPTPATGSIQVTIEPSGAIAAGAQWQIDGHPLQDSGTILSGLSPGTYPILFKSVPGYAIPADRSVTVVADQTATTTGNYALIPSGSLQVTIEPPGAIAAGAQWRVDNGAFQDSGIILSGLSPGSHTVTFVPVIGYILPLIARPRSPPMKRLRRPDSIR